MVRDTVVDLFGHQGADENTNQAAREKLKRDSDSVAAKMLETFFGWVAIAVVAVVAIFMLYHGHVHWLLAITSMVIIVVAKFKPGLLLPSDLEESDPPQHTLAYAAIPMLLMAVLGFVGALAALFNREVADSWLVLGAWPLIAVTVTLMLVWCFDVATPFVAVGWLLWLVLVFQVIAIPNNTIRAILALVALLAAVVLTYRLLKMQPRDEFLLGYFLMVTVPEWLVFSDEGTITEQPAGFVRSRFELWDRHHLVFFDLFWHAFWIFVLALMVIVIEAAVEAAEEAEATEGEDTRSEDEKARQEMLPTVLGKHRTGPVFDPANPDEWDEEAWEELVKEGAVLPDERELYDFTPAYYRQAGGDAIVEELADQGSVREQYALKEAGIENKHMLAELGRSWRHVLYYREHGQHMTEEEAQPAHAA